MAISTRERIGLLRKCYFEETKKEHGMNPHEIHAKPTRFLGILGQQKYCQLGLKGTERVWNQRRLLDPQMVLAGRRLIKLTYKVLTLWKRKDDLGVATSLEGKTKSLEGETKSPGGRDKRVMVDYSQAFKLIRTLEFAQLDFKATSGWWLLFIFHFHPPFWTWMSVTVIPCQGHLGCWEGRADNLSR